MPVIKQRQEFKASVSYFSKFETILGYVRPYLKNNSKQTNKKPKKF